MKLRWLYSLQVWLQSTSVLSVIVGYTVLLVIHGALADHQRKHGHQQLVAALTQRIEKGSPQPSSVAWFGSDLQASLTPPGPIQLPHVQAGASGQHWLLSRTRLTLPDGEVRTLKVRQNVSASIKQQRFGEFLLVAAVSVSILFTSLMLRLVLRRGFVQPLRGLHQQLQALDTTNLGANLVDPVFQPRELRSIAQAINSLQLRLAEAWERERAFANAVSHELRTPITVIFGHSQRLRRQNLSPAAERSAASIRLEAKRMDQLLKVLRDLARSDSARLDLQLMPVDPDQQLLLAYERVLPMATDRLLIPQPANEPHPKMIADRVRLQECLDVLVENALLYSQGAVQMTSEQVGDQMVLHVIDQGPGIPVDERDLVLRRFKRGSTAVGTQGSGIGLALADQLMHAMQGDLLIADADGGGADLQLRFKLAPDQSLLLEGEQ
ncbi:HAMP domain-containing sensor histidine kinase [Synechococcus sp. MIT S9508]|uniref:HAMP domain-containing sensor histidine kinase n=1 Tax=Synechococcus sp. MIT S9508 TaxID=1801629 RepID=UPI0007BC091D|nr:HAMP domain-containing sensor histidine kinase [Synechococcus sp. MIT S9508]KZR89951.1 Sensor protein CzcS precursor [Synechococcus sp. MIT S9508]